ncbi:host cell surface-exposed lipoprotein [Lentilactobacillus sunkii]|jgi:hypothetical protein|uniref:Host cell surface-exposed lipoprotein n=1 Tax=Lentilactobacillus sunkii TaxID=481719 RepID=A0A1E7XD74_9LACO|nr:Ltp family lipoprotein [Lentilactobacillus sunkii]OFA11070.1 host cell surface-exposed lipoprotein [Lentilactobacillus sunkii]
MKRIALIGVTLTTALLLTGCGNTNSSSSDANRSSKQETTTTVDSSSESTKKIPAEYQAALNKADTYARTMSMSKRAIYDQLKSKAGEDFSPKVAYWAATRLSGINWNKNAVEKAKTYQKEMSMSKNAIYDQLTSSYGEKFTPSQAQYAVNHLN